MKKKLQGPKVDGIGVAVVKEMGEDNVEVYNVYVINFNEETIEGVLVSSRGYGVNPNTGVETKTSHLRHFLDLIQGKSFKKVEPIMEDVFGLNNEYWLSFFLDNKMYDKKYIFLPETIQEENLRHIDVINKDGILIL